MALSHADSPALDATSHPFVGVTMSHYGSSNPRQNINIVDIDLAAPGIRFLVTPEVQGLANNPSGVPYTVRRQYTLDFLTNNAAQIAIDAHRYWPTDGTVGSPVNLEGVVASVGSIYESFFNAWRAPPPPNISWPALNLGRSNQVAILYGDPTDPLGHTPLPEEDNRLGHQSVFPPMELYNTVSGNYQVVSNGTPITSARLFLQNDFNPNPRTGIGFTSNNHLILVTVDGGGNPWFGMQVSELGWFMATNFNAWNAISVDGGGSTTLAISVPQPHVVNSPSSGPVGRPVGGNLAVFALPAYIAIANILDGSTFISPTEIDVTATVVDAVGTVTNVDFYASGAHIGSKTITPFTFPWINPVVGQYQLQAVALDNSGLSTTSAVVHVTVAAPPSHVISGLINGADGSPLPGVFLDFSNGGGTAATDASGAYSQSVPFAWTGVVTPMLDCYSFSPSSRSYASVTSDYPGEDFTSTPVAFTFSPAAASFSSGAGSGSFGVSVSSSCSWSASSRQGWVHASGSGTQSGTITYTIDANDSTTPRSGYIVAGGQTFVITQAGTIGLADTGTDAPLLPAWAAWALLISFVATSTRLLRRTQKT